MRAIDADALEPDADYYEGDYWAVSIVQIHNAPTIEVQRKKGKWINHRCDDGHHIADCDQCGHSLQWFDDDTPKYCCECGAKMEGEG